MTSQGSPAATGWRLGTEPHWEVAVSTWVPEPLWAAVCVSGQRCVSYLMACVRPSSRARVVSKYILTAAGEHLDRGGSSVSVWRGRRPADACAWPACRVCRVCLCGRGARVCPVCCGGCSGAVGAGFLPCGVRPSRGDGRDIFTAASATTCVLSWVTSLWAAAVTGGRWRGIRFHKQRNTC